MLTKKQLAKRRKGITSTDISKLVRLNPYGSGLEVYADKLGKSEPKEDTEAMWWGRALEVPLLMRYDQENGLLGWATVMPGETIKSTEDPLLVATPDAFAYTPESCFDCEPERICGIELKTAFSAPQVARWGKGGDTVPEEYLIQCQWCMLVTGLPRWDMAVLLGTYHGLEYRQFTFEPRPRLLDALVNGSPACRNCGWQVPREWDACPQCGEWSWQGVHRWWDRYIIGDEEPPADASGSARRALSSLYPQDDTKVRLASSAEEDLLDDYEGALDVLIGAEKDRDQLKAQLQQRIADSEGLETMDGRRVTWKKNKAGIRKWDDRNLRKHLGGG